MSRALNLEGKRFGSRVVVRRAVTPKGRLPGIYWLVQCGLCGDVKTALSKQLKRTKSCVCFKRTHGMTGTPEYKSWQAMRRRCSNTRDKDYGRYGGRGIRVCRRWGSFKNFIDDLGPRPGPGFTIDRVDNDGNYENNIINKYQQFEDVPTIKVCADNRDDLKTLEPQIIDANKDQIALLRKVLGVSSETTDLKTYMQNNKTECALKIFDTPEDIKFPQYILDAIAWEYGK